MCTRLCTSPGGKVMDQSWPGHAEAFLACACHRFFEACRLVVGAVGNMAEIIGWHRVASQRRYTSEGSLPASPSLPSSKGTAAARRIHGANPLMRIADCRRTPRTGEPTLPEP